MDEQQRQTPNIKIQKVFTYIRELTKLRSPPVANLSAYNWCLRFSTLPSYPTIQKAQIPENNDEEFDGIVLRVKRPNETKCPPPPPLLKDWVENGWEQPILALNHINSLNKTNEDGTTVTEKFDENPERVELYNQWTEKRRSWVEAEIPARKAGLIFSELFKLQGQIQRESEKFQLYIGDGHLLWNSAIEAIDHPILLKKVEIEFDSSVPEFIIRETDDVPELYTNLLRHHNLDGTAILDSKKKLDVTEPHPLANDKTVEFLKYFIQRFFDGGRYYESRNDISGDNPVVYRDPVIFLGNRSQGLAEALDKIIEALPNIETLPEALLRIVGVDETVNPNIEDGVHHESNQSPNKANTSEIDFLLTKPANKEQERVITRLEQTGSVLVQGPPGTGKSHTIANIIGHLLASGKTLLVASHTSKALKVVRDKVVKPLQPLCVSVLDNDIESKSQLEESINGIVGYVSRTDKDSLTREIDQLGARRDQLKIELKKLETLALEIRKGEYSDIVVAGQGIPPSEAARKVSEMESTHGWIPGPLEPSAPLPLTEMEVQELYETNHFLPIDDEKCLEEGLPDFDDLLSPLELTELSVSLKSIDQNIANQFNNFWGSTNQDFNSLDRLHLNLNKTLELFSSHKWIQKIIESSKLGKNLIQPWFNLMNLIETTLTEISCRSELILKHGPQINLDVTPENIKTCKEIVIHLNTGKSLNFFNMAFRSSWKSLISSCRVDEGEPSRKEHFEAILAALETTQLRRELFQRWERQVVSLGGPTLSVSEPEIDAKSITDVLRIATSWEESIWCLIEEELQNLDFNLKLAQEKISLTLQSNSYIAQIQQLIEKFLIPSIESRRLWLRISEIELRREKIRQVLIKNSSKTANFNSYINRLLISIEEFDLVSYQQSLDRYCALKGKLGNYNKRKSLLNQLKKSAPRWAMAIENRTNEHGLNVMPGDPTKSWFICQLRQELDRRLSQDYSSVQREIQRLKIELNGVNSQYVEKLAWRFQHSRTSLKEKQALTGWQQLQNKITKTGKGKRDLQLKREARKTLKDCKNAVPVWIMPLSRVFESFDLVETKFDVILLDEASQSDITALVAFAIAKQVIVVGDNEQVTPYAVGQELGKIQSLIDELLQGIPNRMLYDGKTSVYDLAEQAFGETIRLVEHFRCVPDIIEFSNQLSYNGEIRPLRESSSSPYLNHLISHRVTGSISVNKVNQKEANEVASIIAAMTEFKEYESASIGVISMVGQDQALAIDSILQKRMPTSRYSKHNLLCGNASQFQGDERDIIVISMVDTCDNPPLSIRQTEEFKKSFNVAASRSRNQLWVVHSLNPSTDLKPGDVRLRLIQHAENPKALKQAIEANQKKADPKSVVFEPMVIKDLMLAGFRVVPQYEVGAYTIDMIVVGQEKNVAIECDGDRYHPPEKLADDMQRQLVLERLGWTFIRIRGSEYFRFRESTMKRVVVELESMGIERLGAENITDNSPKIDDLHQRVLQRAFEIRQEWEEIVESEEEIKPKRGRWGRKPTSQGQAASPVSEGNTAIKVELFPGRTMPDQHRIPEHIYRKHTSPDHYVEQEKMNWQLLVEKIDPQEIVIFLKSYGFEIIDKRHVGGSLWVIDDPRFNNLASVLNNRGFQFIFTANGSGSTKDRPAWYCKNKF